MHEISPFRDNYVTQGKSLVIFFDKLKSQVQKFIRNGMTSK